MLSGVLRVESPGDRGPTSLTRWSASGDDGKGVTTEPNGGNCVVEHGDTLSFSVEATQQSLQHRLAECLAPHDAGDRSRDIHSNTDAFLSATSRHVASVEAVLLPSVRRRVPDGDRAAHDYLQVARRLERALSTLTARLYGEAHAVYRSWPKCVSSSSSSSPSTTGSSGSSWRR